METDQTLNPRDAARLRRIADASTGGSWEKILHSPRSSGISPATIDLLEQVAEADGTIRRGPANSFNCEVGGTRLVVRGGREPAFESSTADYPADLPHLRALADHPVEGHGRRVQRYGEQMTITVRVAHGSGSELTTVIAAAQETDYALKQAVAKPGAGYDLMAARFQRAGLAVPRVPKPLKDLIDGQGRLVVGHRRRTQAPRGLPARVGGGASATRVRPRRHQPRRTRVEQLWTELAPGVRSRRIPCADGLGRRTQRQRP